MARPRGIMGQEPECVSNASNWYVPHVGKVVRTKPRLDFKVMTFLISLTKDQFVYL